MAVVFNMRKGGANPPPVSGKPSWTGDYAWDTRYSAQAVVDWVRAGFHDLNGCFLAKPHIQEDDIPGETPIPDFVDSLFARGR